MPKFYIATSLRRAADHNRVRDALVEQGHVLTYDWSLHGSVKSVGLDVLSDVAQKELAGVMSADVLVVLLPGGVGTHAELGMALALGKPVILHSETESPFCLGDQTCAFYHHPRVAQVVTSLDHLEPIISAVERSLTAVGVS